MRGGDISFCDDSQSKKLLRVVAVNNQRRLITERGRRALVDAMAEQG
jgi:hypothetical protein